MNKESFALPLNESGDNNASNSSKGDGASEQKKPICVIVIGMAGSGKSSTTQRIAAHVNERKKASYFINLDPAVDSLPFGANIDIRDSVKYKKVMKDYKLGPNGAIMTSLNLFATKFDQVLNIVENKTKEKDLEYVFVDTPGQIEVFTWSASGTIITESLASSMPTVLLYVVDTPRTMKPATFMSNMLYACSILYKTKLPFIIVFNKIDIQDHEFALEWMQDFESFQSALDDADNNSSTTFASSGYMNSLTRSMSLVLDEFYKMLTAVGVSAATGQGFDELFKKIDEAADEYYQDYYPLVLENIKQRELLKQEEMNKEMDKVRNDLEKQQM